MTPTPHPSSTLLFLLTFILATTLSNPARSQSIAQIQPATLSASDSVSHVVWLKDGSVLFSHHLQIRSSDTADQYLLLDNGLQVPLNEVSRFRKKHDYFDPLPGSAGTDVYKEERVGPLISVYSRTLYEVPADTDGTHPVVFYYRKPGQTSMHLLNFNTLKTALADNPQAQLQLQKTKTQFFSGLALSLVSVAVISVGFINMYRKTASQPLTQPTLPPITYPASPQPLPAPMLPPQSHPSLSPLVVIGGAGFAAGLVLTFGAHAHQWKAIDIYNGVEH